MKHYNIILAIDPSGAFNEGKGTTGWCIMDAGQNKITRTGAIHASDYERKEDYWQAHIDILIKGLKKYKCSVLVVIEDYILYANKAEAHINSRFETSKLIGILQYNLFKNDIPYTMQRAVDVKSRWTNEILEYKHYIKIKGKKFYVRETEINKHILDSIRHAVHYNTFRNGGTNND